MLRSPRTGPVCLAGAASVSGQMRWAGARIWPGGPAAAALQRARVRAPKPSPRPSGPTVF
jgi:hypothetical protein